MRTSAALRPRSVRALTAAGVVATAALVPLGAVAHAAGSGSPAAPRVPVVHPVVFATAPSGASKPDDITELGGLLYVTYQNNAGPDGSPPGSTSTIVVFARRTAAVVTTYTLTGRCDGLTADPEHHRVLASVNEDLNSSLYVITPGNPVPAHFTYSPSPAETGTDGTNGGTDAISIGTDGTIFVAHSNPDLTLPSPNNAAAVYTMTLSGSTANLTPYVGVNDVTKVVNPNAGAPKKAPMGLTDPDSNRFLPSDNGGTLIQDAQADSKLVFITHHGNGKPKADLLNLTNATPPTHGPATPQLDDIERVSGPGVLYAVDQKTGTIYQVSTDSIAKGTLFVSQPAPASGDLPNDPALGIVNPKTGVVTHVDSTLSSPKGLLFVPNDQ